ncbi:uncharacterized protein LOC121368483, partial [Gigantopelta aegis]|uniref:uncharacterized protein LOC121368483 n=1 Tax=Gigantopelta aegis TaxID=1735272 RepID=UPI001B8882CD
YYHPNLLLVTSFNFLISVNDKRAKDTASHIKKELHDKTLEWEKRIWISLPDNEQHKNHIVGEASSFHVFIQETKRHLEIFVAKDQFLNNKTTRIFYPHINDIRNHMYLATMESRYSKIDQNDLEARIYIWKHQNLDDHYFFRL